jgi:phosphoglycerate kinase
MIKSIQDFELSEKRVFIRVDFNVPLTSHGQVVDDSRILATLPTIQYAIESGAKVILASHLGRPKGKRDPKYTLLPVAERLTDLLEEEVLFPEDCIGSAVKKLASEMREGQVLLLENLRFHAEEEASDPVFSEKLASLADVYINDAFGTLHRAHASTVGMVSFVPLRGAGFLVLEEVSSLTKLLQEPESPFVAVLGGAKVSDKLGVIENLLHYVDQILIGGGMAYTFLKAKGIEVGRSLIDLSKIHLAEKLIEKARRQEVRLELPVDHVIAQKLQQGAETKVTEGASIPPDYMGLDIGPKTLEKFKKCLKGAKTILWNGPLGAFEIPPFDQGTLGIAHCIGESQSHSVVGGGDSLAAIKQAGVAGKITHLSTGGGATLVFLEGKKLPGLQALETGDQIER